MDYHPSLFLLSLHILPMKTKQLFYKNNLLKLELKVLNKEIQKIEEQIQHNLLDADTGIFLKIQRTRDIKQVEEKLALLS